MNDFAKVLHYYGFINDVIIGNKVKVKCPFHEDSDPSMLVNVKDNLFYCFGCEEKGDMLKFVTQLEKGNELKAMLTINKIKNNKNESLQIITNFNEEKSLTPKEALEEAKLYFTSLPKTNWNDKDVDTYLVDRGFDKEVLNELDVRENYNHIYSVVAPMNDMGEFKGYVCRATIDEFNGRKITRKYLYNQGFARNATLVGSYDKHWPVVTEGFLDYARLVQFGVDNSCAILGWKATKHQIEKISKYTNKIISALDNTESGERGTKYLSQYFEVVRFEFPEHRKDIGEMKEHEFNIAWEKTMKKVRKANRKLSKSIFSREERRDDKQ